LGTPARSTVALFAKVTEIPGFRGVILFTVLSRVSSVGCSVCQDLVVMTYGTRPTCTQCFPAASSSLESHSGFA
jgi:hypothetical protein